MTTNDQMEIRIYQAPPDTDVFGLRAMPLFSLTDRVEVELPDGTLLYGVVLHDWAEIRSDDSRVLTKTIHVHGTTQGGAQ